MYLGTYLGSQPRFWLNNPRAPYTKGGLTKQYSSRYLFVACLLTFAAVEISTFSRVMTKGLTEQFSLVPLLAC